MIFATVIKKYCGDISILITLAGAVCIGILFLRLLQPILTFLDELQELSGLDPDLLAPIIKCLGVSLLTQICVNICNDAGQNAVGKMIEISGSVLCLYLSIPLFHCVLSLLETIGGNP